MTVYSVCACVYTVFVCVPLRLPVHAHMYVSYGGTWNLPAPTGNPFHSFLFIALSHILTCLITYKNTCLHLITS